GSDEEPADAGSPRVIVYGYDGLLMHLVAPPSPNYVPRPEHPPSPDYVPGLKHPPSPVYVPEPEYPEYWALSRDEEPIEDQPLPTDASPTALSPGYVDDSDLEEDPEEDHADYPADGGDGDDEPSDNDDDDDDTDDEDEKDFEDKEDDDEEEEHLAPPDSSAIHVIPSPPLPVSSLRLPLLSPLTTSPSDTGAPLSYKAAGIRVRALLPSTSHRTNIPEAKMLPRKRACFTTPAPGFEVGESSTAGAARQPRPTLKADLKRDRVGEMGYRITDTWDEIHTDKDRQFYLHTTMLLDKEATYTRRSWTGSEDRSAAIEAHTTPLRRIEILEARDPEPQDEPAEAGISC
ncbi:hypothetical protein Tco_1518309, partial [Tanacetum coccineum]